MSNSLELFADKDGLRRRVDRFLSQHPEVKPTRFGMAVLDDGGLVRSLHAGRQVRLDTARKILAWMAAYEADPALCLPARQRHTKTSSTQRNRLGQWGKTVNL